MGKTVLAVVGLVAAIGIAVAAPWLVGVIGVAGFLGVSTAVATAIVAGVLSVGLSLGFRALGVGAPSTKSAVGPPSVFRQTITNSFIVFGKRRVGGLMVFFHGKIVSIIGDGEDAAHYRYFVIACAGHQCKGVVSWMLGDETVSVNSTSGQVASGKYANNAWLWFDRGTATATANSTFVSECDGKWTANHKGIGVAKIYAKFKMTDKVVEAGMPNITAIIEGADQVRDPRDGLLKYLSNASAVFYHWLRMAREEGGFGAYADEMPDDTWQSAQANVCEEIVSGKKRYELHGVITTGAPPNEIRDTMIVNQAGTYSYSGGKHLMRPGYWVPPTATLVEQDLAGPIQVSAFLASDSATNEVTGTYIKPGDGYQAAPFTTQKTSPAAIDIRQLDLDLAFVTNKDQADRVARIMLRRAQADKSVVWPMNLKGLAIRAMDTVLLDFARYGLGNYAFVVANWTLSPEWSVVVSLREENELIYSTLAEVAAITPPTVAVTAPILPISQITQLIIGSTKTGLTFSVTSAGAITVSAHTRVYPDKSVAVTGVTGQATGAVVDDLVLIYYDDAARAGGAVTYAAIILPGGTGDASQAEASINRPYRHFVGGKKVPASGTSSGGTVYTASTSGGGTAPPRLSYSYL